MSGGEKVQAATSRRKADHDAEKAGIVALEGLTGCGDTNAIILARLACALQRSSGWWDEVSLSGFPRAGPSLDYA